MIRRESWTGPFGPWVRFGIPFPVVVKDSALGRAFLNNGDGDYFSGAYLPLPYDGRRGLALDVTVRLPITRERGQYIEFGLPRLRGVSEMLSSWDHRTGYMPARFFESGRSCEFVYPRHEGDAGSREALNIGALMHRNAQGVPWLALGTPLHVRLQVFPDGRCGIALEGERPWISANRHLGDSLYVMIQGNSVGTRLLLGAITITSGVPPGVDWWQARLEEP